VCLVVVLQGQVSVQGIGAINSFPVDITFKDYKYSFLVTKVAPDKLRLKLGDQVSPSGDHNTNRDHIPCPRLSLHAHPP
jgi:hypothetical protein